MGVLPKELHKASLARIENIAEALDPHKFAYLQTVQLTEYQYRTRLMGVLYSQTQGTWAHWK